MASKSAKKKNIQAIVRVRPLSGAEIMEKSRSIVSVDPYAKTINIREKTTAVKPYGPFDRLKAPLQVYDQEATQAQIYKEVVAPLVLQVLDGFNATVFAYGQTGAGKTYTMEGRHDDTQNYLWEDDPTSGIIPRALHHIFSKLENEKPEDYSVRASYVELYNEQVFDLLGAGEQLRLFDNKDKGVLIAGMEDVPVRNRNEVYSLLKKGAEKRTTASTLMNLTSSRSHSVFTLTVTTRQTIDNEELLRIGKMNLVDLAGSENVGRSGAIEQRAREAGNINTSLLALGRVITALTTNAIHIPYRESKLTRILQDSLGGKTITVCVLLLLPIYRPAASNYEESINTLEYVQRAKNIKNNPVANACLSRKQILLAYDEEIARLQRDLAAARCGGGFYVDKENYDALQRESAESRERIAELEADLANKLSEMTNLINDLNYMDDQYRLAYERLCAQTTRYERGIREQEQLKKELSDVRSNYQSALDSLDIFQGVAERLREKEKLHKENSIVLFDELSIVQDKVSYFRNLLDENDHLLGNFSAKRISAITEAKHTVSNFVQESSTNLQQMTEQSSALKSTIPNDINAIKAASEKAATLLNEVLGLVNTISVQSANSSQVFETASACIDSGLQNQQQLVQALGSQMDQHFTENQRAIEHFAHQEIKREEKTGGTPQRRNTNISNAEVLSPIPSKIQLLKQTERTPQRFSLFKIRDSILEQTMLDSPLTVKTKLPSTLMPENDSEEQ
ncbi:Kinesin-like protein KIF11 [Aphelenchoides bicaudatus]|nr:Kinesin-like protein KIF11 [Aphelenchoides bicaudatus]